MCGAKLQWIDDRARNLNAFQRVSLIVVVHNDLCSLEFANGGVQFEASGEVVAISLGWEGRKFVGS